MKTGSVERIVIAPEQRRRTIIALIRGARRRLLLSIFRCDDDVVLEALAEAVRRGVHVRAIVTGRARAAASELDFVEHFLAAHGVEVRRQTDGLKYHAKYIVVDDTALVASFNFTGKCFKRTCDFAFVTTDATVVSGLDELFAADWERRPVVLTTTQAARLIIGPDHRPRERFAELARAARQQIRVIDARLTDPRVLSLLESRRAAGIAVDVKGRDDLGSLAAHGKLLIIDQTTAVVGSIGLRSAALDTRRELAVVTHDAAIVRQLEGFWRSLPDPRMRTRTPQPEFQEIRP
jgi:cardiolipin synthase